MAALPHPANAHDHLLLGGVDAVQLAHDFGTPLFVYDVADVRQRARALRDAFESEGVSYQVAYASKALSIRAIYEVMVQEELYLDVVSGGELYTALQAGVPAARVHFHGNNKSVLELRYALSCGIGCFVVDSLREVQLLPRLAAEMWGLPYPADETVSADAGVCGGDGGDAAREPCEMRRSHIRSSACVVHTRESRENTGEAEHAYHMLSSFQTPSPSLNRSTTVTTDSNRIRSVNVLLRVAPGITAHTHAYNTTGQVDSKFGLDLASGQATIAYEFLSKCPHVQVLGVHAHIGSQIFDASAHVAAAEKLMALMASWGMRECVLNVGGGYGVRYTASDTPLPLDAYVHAIVSAVKKFVATSSSGIRVPSFWIEPGRSLVSEAGTTLYTVGSQKCVPGLQPYLAVDGGMSDNIRPVTYQAVYSCALAHRVSAPPTHTYHVVGKLCESGDQLIRHAHLPEAQEGDILAVFCTGAYCYAMASNYNKLARPAIVFVESGVAKLVVRRETPEDLIRNELSYT